MLKRTITYISPFTDEEVSEEHYFHISKADMAAMELEEHKTTYTTVRDGEEVEVTGFEAKLQRIIDSQDGKAIMEELEDLIHRSYGVREGDRFVKNDAVWNEFRSSEAYSQLFYEMCTDAEKAAQFTTGILPSDIEQEAARAIAAQAITNGAGTPERPTLTAVETEAVGVDRGDGEQPPRILTLQEIEDMDPVELKAGIANGRYKLS